MTRVFFDASVIFSAIYSNTGASFYLSKLVQKKKIIGITTQTVVKELEKNLDKLKKVNLVQLHAFIKKNQFLVMEEIGEGDVKGWKNIVDSKDAHVLAGALLSKCEYLVTLDKKHLDNSSVKKKVVKIKICSPRDLLAEIIKT